MDIDHLNDLALESLDRMEPPDDYYDERPPVEDEERCEVIGCQEVCVYGETTCAQHTRDLAELEERRASWPA